MSEKRNHRGYRKYFKLNYSVNRMYKILRDLDIKCIEGNFIAFQPYVRKEEFLIVYSRGFEYYYFS